MKTTGLLHSGADWPLRLWEKSHDGLVAWGGLPTGFTASASPSKDRDRCKLEVQRRRAHHGKRHTLLAYPPPHTHTPGLAPIVQSSGPFLPSQAWLW